MAGEHEPEQTRGWLGPLVAGVLALVHGLILLARGHPYDIDRLTQSLPAADALRRAVAAGTWPLWEPGIWAGHPLHAEGQYGFCSPLKLLHALAPDAVGALDLEQLAALAVCAIGAAGAARLLGRSAPGAAACGVLWALGGANLAWQTNPGMVATHALLPLVLALALRQRWLGLGLALAFAILAGHPYGYALTIAAAGVACLVGGAERPPLRARVLGGLAALGLALALGAVQWLPTADLALRSDRWLGAGSGPANPLRPGDLRYWIQPWIDARPRYSGEGGVLTYLGLPALLLALVGGGCARAERGGRVVLALGAGTLALALLASATGGASELPLLRLLRGPSKLLFLVCAALCLLLARGVDRLGELHPAAAWVAVAVIALDVGWFAQRHADPVPREALRAPPAIAADLPAGARLRTVEAELPWGRELPDDPAEQTAFLAAANPLDTNQGIRFGVGHLDGYAPIRLPRAVIYISSLAPARMRRGGVTHLVIGPKLRLPAPYELVRRAERWSLYRLPGARPRAFAATRAVAAADPAAARAQADQAPLGVVVVEGAGRDLPRGAARLEPAIVAHRTPTRIELRLQLREPAVVVVADAFDPGWAATVDGVAAPVRPVDGAFLGVVVPAGTRAVTFTYRPGAFRLGLGVSGWALFGLLLAGLCALRRR